MAKTWREIAVAEMPGTVEDAMRKVLNCWADLPPSMHEAIMEFRTQLMSATKPELFRKYSCHLRLRGNDRFFDQPDREAVTAAETAVS